MGIDQAKQTNNAFDIQCFLDKSICFPGESINGVIQVKTAKPRLLNAIQIDISQEEFWCFKQTKKTKSSKIILETTAINIMNTLLPGEYKFNFSIKVPLFTKPSFEYPLDESNAYIRTFIQVSNLEYSGFIKQMVLIKKPATPLDSLLTLTETNNPKLMFIEQGPIIIQASYPSNNYSFYSQIPINVSIDWTKSKLSIKAVDASLIRRIKYLNNGVEDKSLIFEEVLWKVTKPLSGGKFNFSESILLSDTEEMKNRYTYSSHNMTFPDKGQIIRFMPSLKTGFIDCDYFIKIVCTYEIFLAKIPLIDKPTLIMPLSISHYSSIDVANSMIKMGQQLESQFNKNNNVINPMMSEIKNQYQLSPNQTMPQKGSQYQPIPNQMMTQQGMNQYQPNQNPMLMSQLQGMNHYQPNPNIAPPQQNIDTENMKKQFISTPMNNNNLNGFSNIENNYPSAESLDPPPSNQVEKETTKGNLYPKFA